SSGVHRDDLRFYALLHTIRTGVPPFRVATYYLDSATFLPEDVTEDLLFDVALPRVVDGVTRVVELHLRSRAPRTTPGPLCSWCPRRLSCDAALLGDGDRKEVVAEDEDDEEEAELEAV
ncbi:MAG TPA: hypothetical protein VFK43_00270, partial [Acidimicrobiales bacterium]|nr:hypothetical protein [Acidimicrobiales bacterium]